MSQAQSTQAGDVVSLGEAKQIVHTGEAWSDARDDFEQLQVIVEQSANEL